MPIANSILKSKFFLPQSTSDFVERKSLISKFESLKTMPLMLVSASTGYGKSTIVSSYLVNQNEDYAWLSLSERESDFQQFILYFIKAIQSRIPDFGDEILGVAYAPELPSIDELTKLLLNELAELKSHLYLAIDDYHLISNNQINLFISKLFDYPHPFFRLILITRRDPELPFSIWRSKNKLIEIRSSELKFSRSEITEFYIKSLSYFPEDNVLSSIEKATEGWISGIRMLMLSSNSGKELQESASNFNYKNSRVIHDLVNTVLNNQSALVKGRLLKLSILKEFNVELFSELCLDEKEWSTSETLFNEFTSELIRTNMFIIAIDDKHSWYRFHHLFSDQLSDLLFEKYETKVIEGMMLSVADWYYNKNLPEDAIEYYLKANQHSKALVVFTEYRLKLIAETRFEYLDNIVSLFPQELRDKKGIFIITNGWLLLQKGNIPEMTKQIEKVEAILREEDITKELQELLLGEMHAMMAFNRYLSNVDMQACLEHSKKAIRLLKDKNPYALGIAWVYYGAALQHLGKPAKARRDLYRELEVCSSDILRGHILIVLSFLDWFDGNLTAMQQIAKHLIRLGIESGIKYLTASGNILAGISYYYQFQDEKALGYLEKAHELRHYALQHMSFPAIIALVDIYAKSGKEIENETIMQMYENLALNQSGKLFIKMTKSASAELAFRYQNDLSGLKWAKENDYKDFLPMANLYSPELVQARILVLDEDPKSHNLAQEIINNTIPFFEKRNDINILIRAFILQALIYYKNGDLKNAIEFLQKSLDLSSIGHYIRPYLYMGESMKNLLLEYKAIKKKYSHVDEILQGFTDDAIKNAEINLSEREKEILLLSEKLTNKEVGNQLFIAEKTVKSHITNINKKLDVHSKLEAISKAKNLKLI